MHTKLLSRLLDSA